VQLTNAPAQVLQRGRNNITIASTSLLLISPLITGIWIANGWCGRVAALDNVTLVCYDWPCDANAGLPTGNAAVMLAIKLIFGGSTIALRPMLYAFHAPQVWSVFPVAAIPCVRVGVLGMFFRVSNDTTAHAAVGGLACTVMSSNSVWLECALPLAIPASTSGFPSLAVTVTTIAGASSDDVRLTIQPQASASFISCSTILAMGSTDSQLLPVSPAPVLRVTGALPIKCTLGVSAWVCSIPTFQYGTPYTVSSGQVALVGSITQSLHTAGSDSISVFGVGFHAPAGCTANVSAQCQDANDRTCSSDNLLQIESVPFSMKWSGDSDALHVLQDDIVPVPGTLVEWPAGFTYNASNAHLAQQLSCVAALIINTSNVLVDVPLSMLAAVANTASGSVSSINTNAVAVSFPGLTSHGCLLGAAYALHTECVWLPTSERARLKPLPVGIASLHLNVHAGHSSTDSSACPPCRINVR
jgi:hypothetical protein